MAECQPSWNHFHAQNLLILSIFKFRKQLKNNKMWKLILIYFVYLKVVTNEKGEAVGDVLTIIC